MEDGVVEEEEVDNACLDILLRVEDDDKNTEFIGKVVR